MKRSILTVALISSLTFLSACTNNTDGVKNGFLYDYSKSVTVGDAFDNYKYCSAPKWQEFETEQKEQIVRFTCSLASVVDSLKSERDALKKPALDKIESYTQAISKKDEKFAQNIFDEEMGRINKQLSPFSQSKQRAELELQQLQEEHKELLKKRDHELEYYRTEIKDPGLLRQRQKNFDTQVRISLQFISRAQQKIDNTLNNPEYKNLQNAKEKLESSAKKSYLDFLQQKVSTLESELATADEEIRKKMPAIFLQSAEFTTDFAISKQDSSFSIKGMWTNFCWDDGKCYELNHDGRGSLNDSNTSLTLIYGNEQPLWYHNPFEFGLLLNLMYQQRQ